MSDVQIQIAELAERICKEFCKFNNTGDKNKCVWCQTHDNECPLDKMLEEHGLK